MSDIVFPEGISYKLAPEDAPDYVRGKISIKTADYIAWLEKQDGEWVNLDLMVSKKGTGYLKVNTWKKDEPKAENLPKHQDREVEQETDNSDSSLPF